jgi:hypothetical protein
MPRPRGDVHLGRQRHLADTRMAFSLVSACSSCSRPRSLGESSLSCDPRVPGQRNDRSPDGRRATTTRIGPVDAGAPIEIYSGECQGLRLRRPGDRARGVLTSAVKNNERAGSIVPCGTGREKTRCFAAAMDTRHRASCVASFVVGTQYARVALALLRPVPLSFRTNPTARRERADFSWACARPA